MTKLTDAFQLRPWTLEDKGKRINRIEEDDDIQVYKKPWVNLTDDEIDAIEKLHWYERPDLWGLRKFIREIEAKLRDKNT